MTRPHPFAANGVRLVHHLATAAMATTAALAAIAIAMPLHAQCPPFATVQNFAGVGRFTCPCFASGEQAAAILDVPPADYPIEILRVGIGWGSLYGSTPASLEQAIHIYAGGLPDPGVPVFTLEGPVLNDGAINQFDLEPIPGEILVESGPFTVALEFMNANAGDIFAPSVVYDGDGCQPGKNAVRLDTGAWSDACGLGVSGDWLMFVTYRPCALTTGVGERTVESRPLSLLPPRPNPARGPIELEFVLAASAPVTLGIVDLAGRRVTRLVDGYRGAGPHRVSWDGRSDAGAAVAPGVYFVELRVAGERARRTVLIAR